MYGPGYGSAAIYADYNGDGVLDYAFDSNTYSFQVSTVNYTMAVLFGARDGTYPTGPVVIPSSSNTPRALRGSCLAGLLTAAFIAGCSTCSNPTPTPPAPQKPIGTSAVTVTAQASGTNGISKVSQLTVTITQ